VAVEAAHPMSWHRWVGGAGAVVGLERFGASAPYERIYRELGVTPERVAEVVRSLLDEVGRDGRGGPRRKATRRRASRRG